MLNQIGYMDIKIGTLENIYNKNIKLNFFYTPRVLTEHSFYFNPRLLKEWWKEGYEYGESFKGK